MKKIGICTLHDANPNFGATLQAFALQEVLKKMGYEQTRKSKKSKKSKTKRKNVQAKPEIFSCKHIKYKNK